jgi:small-conductance mechanosensitive channel
MLFKLAIPVLLSLALIRLCARVLMEVFPMSPMAQLSERLISWLAWGVAVLWITDFLPLVAQELEQIKLNFGKVRLDVRTLLEGLLSCGLVLVLSLWLSATIEQRLLARAVSDLSMRKAAANVVRAGLLLLGLMFALSTLGVDLTALSVLGGALGVGIGFGLQKLAANYISGFVILLERSLRIGDMVKVDGFEGVVTDITTRFTSLRALDGRESIVPNEMIITQRIENSSLADSRITLTLPVTVGPQSDVALVQKIMCAAANHSDKVLADPAPAAFLRSFVPDGLEFVLVVWIADPASGQLGVRSAVNQAILKGLQAEGIELARPSTLVVPAPK